MLKLLSLFGYVLMVGGLIGLILTRNLLSPFWFVIVPQLLALGLMIWARLTFGRRSFHLTADPTQGGLVIWGPYRFIRHPIYTAVCLLTLPGVLAHFSETALAFGCLVLAGSMIRIFIEEQLLARKYPDYGQYAARTRRMLPFVF